MLRIFTLRDRGSWATQLISLASCTWGHQKTDKFGGIFNVSAQVALEAWNLMGEINCLHLPPQLVHYSWALAFMRLYPPNDITLSISLGGSNPKTIWKHMWPMIDIGPF